MTSGEIPPHFSLDRVDFLPPDADCIAESPKAFDRIDAGEQRDNLFKMATRTCGGCALKGSCPEEAINFMGVPIAVFNGTIVESDPRAVEAARTQEPTFTFPMGKLPDDKKGALQFIRVHYRAGTLEAKPGEVGRAVADLFINQAETKLSELTSGLDASEITYLCTQLYGLITNDRVTDGVPVSLFSALSEQIAHGAMKLKTAGYAHPVELTLRHRPEIFEGVGTPLTRESSELLQSSEQAPRHRRRSTTTVSERELGKGVVLRDSEATRVLQTFREREEIMVEMVAPNDPLFATRLDIIRKAFRRDLCAQAINALGGSPVERIQDALTAQLIIAGSDPEHLQQAPHAALEMAHKYRDKSIEDILNIAANLDILLDKGIITISSQDEQESPGDSCFHYNIALEALPETEREALLASYGLDELVYGETKHTNPALLEQIDSIDAQATILIEASRTPQEKLEALRKMIRTEHGILSGSPPVHLKENIASLKTATPFTDVQLLALRRLNFAIHYGYRQTLDKDTEQHLFTELAPILLAEISALKAIRGNGPRFAISYSPTYLDGLVAEFMPIKEVTKNDIRWACKMTRVTPRTKLYEFITTIHTLRQGDWPLPLKGMYPLKVAARSSNPVATMATMQSQIAAFNNAYPGHRFLKEPDFYRLCFGSPGAAMDRAADFIRTCEVVAPEFANDPDLADRGLRIIARSFPKAPGIVRSRIFDFKASVQRTREMYSDRDELDEDTLRIITNARPFQVEKSVEAWFSRYKTLTDRFEGEIEDWVLKDCLAHNLFLVDSKLVVRLRLYNDFLRTSLSAITHSGEDMDPSKDKRLEDKTSLGINPARALEDKEAAIAHLKQIFSLVQALALEERMAVMEAYQIGWQIDETIAMTPKELKAHFRTEDLKAYVDIHIMPQLRQAAASR